MEDLLSALSDYLLQSGFNDNFWYEMPEGEQTLEELRQAIEQALLDRRDVRRGNARPAAANADERPDSKS